MKPLITENIMGYPVSVHPADVCISHIFSWIESEGSAKVFVCANPHSLVMADTDPQFKAAIHGADLVTPDGIGILIASRIRRGQIRERVTGSDIFCGLSQAMNQKPGNRPRYFFLGSTTQILSRIKKKLAEDYPGIQFAGGYSPPFKSEFDESDSRKMVQAVNAAKPDVLWVGMTAPKQEKWVYQNRDQLDVKIIGAVGAVFDFYTGQVRRSSPTFQKFGLEWLPRLIQEPRRLFYRNFVSAPKFLLKMLL